MFRPPCQVDLAPCGDWTRPRIIGLLLKPEWIKEKEALQTVIPPIGAQVEALAQCTDTLGQDVRRAHKLESRAKWQAKTYWICGSGFVTEW